MIKLRTYVYIDSLQPQLAAYMATVSQGFLPVPGFALRLALGEFAESILESQRVIPSRLLAAGYVFRQPELAPALHDLLRRPPGARLSDDKKSPGP